jgi:tryptophan synthase beta chain
VSIATKCSILEQSLYPELERFLRERLRAKPLSPQLRLSLLELFYQNKDVEGFVAEARIFTFKVPDYAATSQWQKCLAMGHELAPRHELFQAGFSRSASSLATSFQVFGTGGYRRFGDDEHYVKFFAEISREFQNAWADSAFQSQLDMELTFIARRPSPLVHARRLSQVIGGAQIYLKREDSSPRETHLSMSIGGQALLGQRLGRDTLVVGTKDDSNGVLTASIAARLGMQALIFIDEESAASKAAEVFSMEQLGAVVRVVPTDSSQSLAPRELALRHWAKNPSSCMLIPGLEGAPQPYPKMNREFVAAIGRESQRQLRVIARRPADLIVARGDSTADALGMFPAFIADRQTRLVCIECSMEDGPSSALGSWVLPNEVRSPAEEEIARTILRGLGYPSVKREHTWLRSSGRVEYLSSTLAHARRAVRDLGAYEGILPAIQTAAALGWAFDQAANMKPEQVVVVMIAEDAAKDIWELRQLMQSA